MDAAFFLDVDHTLVDPHKSHIKLFNLAIEKAYGIKASIEIINYHGMPDKAIIANTLRAKGLSDSEIESGMEDCVNVMLSMADEVLEVEVEPGAKELLDYLKTRNALIVVVTGSLEGLAIAKLKQTGLLSYIAFGKYGSESSDKRILLKLALEESHEHGWNGKNAFMIGDSLTDIRAAKENTIPVIAVTTGSYSKEQLKGADYIVDNLRDIIGLQLY